MQIEAIAKCIQASPQQQTSDALSNIKQPSSYRQPALHHSLFKEIGLHLRLI